MALPVPVLPARYAGSRITAAQWKADVTDAANFFAGPPQFVGTQSVVQSVAGSTWVPLGLDTTQVDSYGGHSNTVNSSRYTARVAGWYTVCGVAVFTVNSAGGRGSRIQVNGNPVPGTASFGVPGGSNAAAVATPTRDVYLAVGDYVEIAGWQGSSGALSTLVASDVSSSLYARFSHA
ncbi:hypothetical protein ACFYST_06035 [Kitasatospora sp. NPDC004614]|uniref:hypothetical protein n=1 Tax=unclassified Kitasatospora TaxID=2633591 RepID=UPI0036A84828